VSGFIGGSFYKQAPSINCFENVHSRLRLFAAREK
jgi:hypothetical protein